MYVYMYPLDVNEVESEDIQLYIGIYPLNMSEIVSSVLAIPFDNPLSKDVLEPIQELRFNDQKFPWEFLCVSGGHCLVGRHSLVGSVLIY